jgi:hypothetical protein
VGGIAFTTAGDLLFTDSGNHVVRMIDHNTGIIITVGGNGASGNTGDNGLATSATMSNPKGLAVDAAGHIFVVDQSFNVVRMFTVGGNIKTVVGNGFFGDTGDSGPATSASLASPVSLAIDSFGNLYIGEDFNGRIRKAFQPAAGW